jgi:hypothetical protein
MTEGLYRTLLANPGKRRIGEEPQKMKEEEWSREGHSTLSTSITTTPLKISIRQDGLEERKYSSLDHLYPPHSLAKMAEEPAADAKGGPAN